MNPTAMSASSSQMANKECLIMLVSQYTDYHKRTLQQQEQQQHTFTQPRNAGPSA